MVQSIPPKIKNSAPLSPAFFAAVVSGFAIIGASAVIYFFNPSTHGFYPVCLFHAVTGWNCPGCGGTRAVYALLHGNFSLALKDNALFVLTLPVLAVWGARKILQQMRNQPVQFKFSPNILWSYFAVMVIFSIVRNLPGFEWLSP